MSIAVTHDRTTTILAARLAGNRTSRSIAWSTGLQPSRPGVIRRAGQDFGP
jgi:hypothetical protein